MSRHAQANGMQSSHHGRRAGRGLRRRLGVGALSVGLVASAASVVGLNAVPAAAAGTVTVNFAYTGAAQTWKVPSYVTSATFDLFGGSGGQTEDLDGGVDDSSGGQEASVTMAVTPNATLQVNVGGVGGVGGATGTGNGGTGGFNGGGTGGSLPAQYVGGGTGAGGGGGGASDVRNGAYGLSNRLIVAAGGAGGALFTTYDGSTSGSGLDGISGGDGTSTAGGAGGFSDDDGYFFVGGGHGGFGVGGVGGAGYGFDNNDADKVPGTAGGGGGGGWYGGGGGTGFYGDDEYGGPGPGGVGSNDGPSGTVFNGGGTFPASGAGKVSITYASLPSPTISTMASGSVPVGGDISDTATLSGGSSPSGTVVFTLFAPGDTNCQTAIATITRNSRGNTFSSGNVVTTTAGTYNWVATYAGDSTNAGVASTCGSEPVVVTKVSPGITTKPSGTVPVGGNLSDTATLTGGYTPTGPVTFSLFAPGDTSCHAAIDTITGTKSGATYSSGNVVATAAGTYNWVAMFAGDVDNNSATSPCGSETVSVTKATPGIATVPSPTVPVGGNVSDTATVSGGYSPTGSVTFTLFAPGDVSCRTPIDTIVASKSGTGYSSGTVVASAAGTYNWVATYGGDANNNTATSPCSSETVSVTKATPGITTSASGGAPAGGAVSDTATVSGGYSPTGTVTFALYPAGSTFCTGTAVATVTSPLIGGIASSGSVAAGGAGTENWLATYSGDANNNQVGSVCGSEPVTIVKDSPTITTTASPSVPAGGVVSDVAALGVAYDPATITFTLYAPGDTNCDTPIATEVGVVTAGIAHSGGVTIGAAGTYNWVAYYPGDANNNPALSPCGSEPVVITPQVLTGRAFGLSADVTSLGSPLLVIPATPDTSAITTTSTGSTSTPCAATVTGLLTVTAPCANVRTVAFPGSSVATASVANVVTGITGVPAITIRAITSTSTTTCVRSSGSVTIAYLRVGPLVLIDQPTKIAPNTTIDIGVVKLVLNEQTRVTGPDQGLTVNAVHLTVSTGSPGAVNGDVILASSESDIGNCP